MNTGLTMKPLSGVAVTDYAQATSVPGGPAAATDLPAAKTVTAAAAASALLKTQARPTAATPDYLSRAYIIDPESHEVIFRVMDTRTRQVIRQVPDQALLRMHAYARALASAPAEPMRADVSA